MKSLLPMLLLTVLPGLALAQAQTVWRCGPDGRSFSDRPCAQGQALQVDSQQRPQHEVDEARARAERERHLADRMTRERLRTEAQTRGSGYSGIPLAQPAFKPAAQARPLPRRKPRHRSTQPEDAGIWRAVAPASPRAPG